MNRQYILNLMVNNMIRLAKIGFTKEERTAICRRILKGGWL